MNRRVLGRTGLEVTELSLGGVFVSRVGGEREQGIATLHAALDAGINYLDTSPSYADSETVLGEALAGETRPVILSTKFSGFASREEAHDPAALKRCFENSLRLLGRDYVDILMVHEPDRPRQYDYWTDWDRFYGPVTDVLAELKAEGRIGFTGLGGTTAYQLPRVMDTGEYDVVLTAFNYSLLWREAEWEVLPTAARHNMGVVIGSPLQNGSLARRYDEEVSHGAPWLSLPRRRQYQALYALLDETGMPLPEMGLRFVLSNPQVSTTLVGARSPQEIMEAVEAVDRGPLPAELLARLQEIEAMVPFRPSGEPSGLPWGREYRGPGWLQ